jgi:carbonic anhydrase
MQKLYTAVLLAVVACGAAFGQSWNHDPNSPIGPPFWGFLGGYNPFATCGTDKQTVGTRQTPIDIDTAGAKQADIPSLNFRYSPTKLVVENLGHVVEVVNEADDSALLVGPSLADNYHLVQFHFHTPSEHKIDGVAAQMELHLVHQNALGELAVVGVLMKVDNDKANPVFDLIFNNAPYLFFHTTSASDPHGEINPADMLPQTSTYYNYAGSLTTPPCSEGVHWFVLTQPAYVSSNVVAIYQRLLAQNPGNNGYPFNARPTQLLNSRPVLVSK